MGISGSSSAIKEIRELVVKYSPEDEPLLILGETGVGKNYLAELIHKFSLRKGSFICVHTPGIPELLLESELCGHKKGAYTGADRDTDGYMAVAHGGSLFLDEIGEMSLSLQIKILRLIETRKYARLGESREREADIRIIAASNKDLGKAVSQKAFREDLLFRLDVLSILIPPLRERKEDIVEIVEDSKDILRGKILIPEAFDVLMEHDWPGNIRELRNVLKKAVIHTPGEIIGREIDKFITRNRQVIQNKDNIVYRIWDEINNGKDFWEVVWRPFMNRDIDRTTIKMIIRKAYEGCSNNFKKALLKMNLKDKDYHNVMTLMKNYRIDPRN